MASNLTRSGEKHIKSCGEEEEEDDDDDEMFIFVAARNKMMMMMMMKCLSLSPLGIK